MLCADDITSSELFTYAEKAKVQYSTVTALIDEACNKLESMFLDTRPCK